MPLPSDWWSALYDETVAELLLVRRDEAELQATVAFLIGQLHLTPGQSVFDQCCGIGSLSLPLARAGLHVLGVDQSKAYVERARHEAALLGGLCDFHHADAFAFVPEPACAAAFNWNTSFGNADDRRNLRMLERAFQAVGPGGRFVLDYPNIPQLLRHFQHCLVRRQEVEGGELLLLRESVVDLAGGALRQRWTIVTPDHRQVVRHTAIRLYLPHVLAEMLGRCGFVEPVFHGGVRGEKLELDSPRCICVARRPIP